MKCRSCLILFGCFLLQISIGVYYSSGIVHPDVFHYMQNHSIYGGKFTSAKAIWIFGTMQFGMGIAVSAGGYLENKIGPALTTLIGGWLMSLNVCLTYFTINSYLSVMILSYGLCAGIGAGIAYGVVLGTVCKWFPNHRGRVIGIVLSAMGISETIFNIFFGIGLDYIPMLFVILGSFCAVFQLLGVLLIRRQVDSRNVDSIQSHANVTTSLFNPTYRQLNSERNLKPYELFLEFDFWILWMTYILNSSSIAIFSASFAGFGSYLLLRRIDYLFVLSTSSTLIGGIFNFAGSIFFGFIIDRKPYKMTMLFLTLANSALIGTFLLLLFPSSSSSRINLFLLWVCALNFLKGGHFAVFPTICVKLFGLENFVTNYGILYSANSISGVLISVLINVCDPGNRNSFITAYVTGCIMSFFAAALTLSFRGRSQTMLELDFH